MKRILSAILVLCLLFALSGCAPKEYTLVEQVLGSASFETDKDFALFTQVLARKNNTRSAEQLATKQYPLSLMLAVTAKLNAGGSLAGNAYTTQGSLERWYTVEIVRQIGDRYYIAYKIHEGGWLYLFTENKVLPLESGDVPLAVVTHSLYIREKADKQALAAIGEGSSFADVCAADPTAAVVRENDGMLNRVPKTGKCSLHWVDNEVFVFTYDDTGETVTGVEHYPDGRVPSSVDGWYFDYNLRLVDRLFAC